MILKEGGFLLTSGELLSYHPHPRKNVRQGHDRYGRYDMMQEFNMSLATLNPTLAQMLGSDAPAGGATTAAPGTPGGAPGQQAAPGGSNIFFFAIIMMVGMFLIMSMSGRKEKKKRASMLDNLGKRDKVRSAGGIIGTIVELKENEVLIETDKSSHTRLWLAKGSVSAVLDSAHSTPQDSQSA